jgi:transcriptional regulator with XRE-family HTH domain
MTRGAERIKGLIEDAKARGLTKSKIAKAMGITPQHLSNLLSGKNEWKLRQVEAVCEILKISPAQAFLEEGEDAELFVLLKQILDAGPEPYRAIAWNIHGIARQINEAGPTLRPATQVLAIKKKRRSAMKSGKEGRFEIRPGTIDDLWPRKK